jgi:superfamily II DNA/RNA helicase
MCNIFLVSYFADLIAEAKSGTGKTVMFGVIALEMLELPSKSLQVCKNYFCKL